MALYPESNTANLCRVCTQDVTYIPSENIFESGSPNIYSKLKAICSEVFSADPEQKPLINEALALPSEVCSDCKSKIDDAYELHRMCIESNRKLWEMLIPVKSVVKQEIEDVTEVDELQLTTIFVSDLSELNVKRGRTKGKAKKEVRNPRTQRCEKCNATIKRALNMYKHMKLKHPDEALECSKCVAVFFDNAKLEKHLLTHTTDRPHSCPNCKKMFKSQRAIRIHSVFCSGQTPFLCTECGKGFPHRTNLVQHQVRHKEKAFACDQCPSKFYTKGSLKGHMVTHTKERNFNCETCGSRFTMKHALVKHMKTHLGQRERPFPCDVCNLRFTNRDHLRRHMRTHTGEKPYKCTHCDRAFTQTNDLVKHSKTHFGDKPYKCDRCAADFRLLTELRNHYKVHYQSGEAADQLNPIKFTIVSTLNRRAKQEIHGNARSTDGQSSGEQCPAEKVQTILADLSKFPMEMENKGKSLNESSCEI
ncbi:gastrula zinc finger protein XlCGF57.1-like [Armigeres subalbatus]|uniref:gastrula zinc finger protein XlCGF57.1-like n=1 Tax=Armigeres subalbatus TaxID=124917 RepID=UPI002ED1550C